MMKNVQEITLCSPKRRAEAVRAQLLARGIEAERLIATGMGHTDPIADNISKSGKAANRRIEFLLITKDQQGIPAPAKVKHKAVANRIFPRTNCFLTIPTTVRNVL